MVDCERKIYRTRATHNKMDLFKLQTSDKMSDAFNLIVLDLETMEHLRRNHKEAIAKQLEALNDKIERPERVYEKAHKGGETSVKKEERSRSEETVKGEPCMYTAYENLKNGTKRAGALRSFM